MKVLTISQKIEDIIIRIQKEATERLLNRGDRSRREVVVRSTRGLGDLVIDIGYIAAGIIGRDDIIVWIACRSNHFEAAKSLQSKNVRLKRIGFIDWMTARDLWRNKWGRERRLKRIVSLRTRYEVHFSYIYEAIRLPDGVVPNIDWWDYEKVINDLGSLVESFDIVIVNSFALSSQINDEVVAGLDSLAVALKRCGVDVATTRPINDLIPVVSLENLSRVKIRSNQVIGVATGPIWFTFGNPSVKRRVMACDKEIIDFSKNDTTMGSIEFLKSIRRAIDYCSLEKEGGFMDLSNVIRFFVPLPACGY